VSQEDIIEHGCQVLDIGLELKAIDVGDIVDGKFVALEYES
jgi:hypothetical protein